MLLSGVFVSGIQGALFITAEEVWQIALLSQSFHICLLLPNTRDLKGDPSCNCCVFFSWVWFFFQASLFAQLV